MNTTPASTDPKTPPLTLLAMRGAIGGLLMGLANLVPGISGGTMLLAAGVYPRFIAAIGELSTFKLRKESVVVLGAVVAAAAVAVVGLAGPVKELVVHHRWIMYSLFIGLTLGGVPVVNRLIRAAGGMNRSVWTGVVIGFLGMAALAYVQMKQATGGTDNTGFIFMLLAGAAGASAMILPGVSGGYLLLVLGVYVPILAAISTFTDAARALDTATLMSVGMGTILPVGIGVIIGIVLVSNVLKWLLARYEQPTLGVLLGLLLGAVIGLYPFVHGVEPKPGDTLKRQVLIVEVIEDRPTLIYEGTRKAVEPEDYPTAMFTPAVIQVIGACGLILGGFATTMLIDRFGAERKTPPSAA